MRGRSLDSRQRILAIVALVVLIGGGAFLVFRTTSGPPAKLSGAAENPPQGQPATPVSPTPAAPTVGPGFVGISIPLDANNPLTPYLAPGEIIDVMLENPDGSVSYIAQGLRIITVQANASTGLGAVAPAVAPGAATPTPSISGSMFVEMTEGPAATNLVTLINSNAFKIHYAIEGTVTPTPAPTAVPKPTAAIVTAKPATPAPTAIPTPTPTAHPTPSPTATPPLH